MKTTFGRTFSTAATILLLALLLLGTTFQYLVQDFLTKNTISELQNDAEMISNLASAYSIDGSLTSRDFLLNLDVAAKVSGSDAVICSPRGEVLLCSDALFGCEHQGMFIDNAVYLQKVLDGGGDLFTGIIDGLYAEPRYVVSRPILSADGSVISGMILPGLAAPVRYPAALSKKVTVCITSATDHPSPIPHTTPSYTMPDFASILFPPDGRKICDLPPEGGPPSPIEHLPVP